jgi:hypothetical protein
VVEYTTIPELTVEREERTGEFGLVSEDGSEHGTRGGIDRIEAWCR